MLVGLISDTHGLLRPEAVQALRGVDVVLHAGDVGSDAVLEGLAELAPVHAVRGNVDRTGRAALLPSTLALEFAGLHLFLVHDGKRATVPGGTHIVVCGHSHQPRVATEGEVLWINPGSAGPRRFRLPVGVGVLRVGGGPPAVRLIPLLPEEGG
jgi:putative phosphoesterase